MKKIIILCATYCLSAFVGNIKAQTTYDVFSYTEPKGYKKEIKTGATSYTKTDNKTGTYCIISLYAQSSSSGDLPKDFDNDWKELVATPLGVKDAPKAGNNDDITGWKTYSGAANFEYSGGTSMALLTTAKKENANISILVVTNAQGYLTEVDAFLDKLKLGKPKIMVVKNNISVKPNSPAITSSSFIEKWNTTGTGSMSDYSFNTPPEWKVTVINNSITITDAWNTIFMQPLVAGNVNLEASMPTYFKQVFKDYKIEESFYQSDYFEKGKTIQGFNYYLERKTMTDLQDGSRASGSLLLIQVNNKLAIISNTTTNPSFMDMMLNYVLYSLTFTKGNSTSSMQQDIVGGWSLASSNVGVAMTFYQDGNFAKGGASIFKTEHNATYDKITTNSNGYMGNYSLNGNLLSTYYKSNKQTYKNRIRFFSNKTGTDNWSLKMGMIDIDTVLKFSFGSVYDRN